MSGPETHHGKSATQRALFGEGSGETPGAGGVTTLIANDEDITVPAAGGTTVVLFTALTAPRVVNMPPASGPAQQVIVVDADANATPTNSITLVPTEADGFTATVFAITAPIQTPSGVTGASLAFTNDGVSQWSDMSGTTALLASLGGTDGDGNVYSINYDPDVQGLLSLQCVATDGTISLASVGPAVSEYSVRNPNDSSEAVLQVVPSAMHWSITTSDGGITKAVDLEDVGLRIDGVLCDPSAPWPGG